MSTAREDIGWLVPIFGSERLLKLSETIVDWPNKMAEIQLDDLAGAEQLLTKNAIALAAAQIEIKANGCDNIGIDQVISESLLDASEWLAWVKEVRENLASNAAK